MTFLYSDATFLDHDTGDHPERAARLEAVTRHLEDTGLAEQCKRPTWQPASAEALARNHGSDYIVAIEQFAKLVGGGAIGPDTIVSSQSFDVARLAAGAVCDAVQQVTTGPDRIALCLVRPPGHHAEANTAMGFCLFNNIAVAAHAALAEHGLDRVLIVDWDVHHGNGTQAAFYDDPRVGFLSIHRWPFYPGTGTRNETGKGDGLGTVRNLPIEYGTPREEYMDLFVHELRTFAEIIRPQLILVSAGFDTHREDPVGSLHLETEDFATLATALLDVADVHAEGRVVSVLEGGYNPPVLAECVALHLETTLQHGPGTDGASR